MTDSLPPEEEDSFREKCRAFLHAYPFPAVADLHGPAELEACRRFQRSLFEAGLAGLTYPCAWGGQGLARRHEELWREEAALYPLLTRPLGVSHGMCLPVLNQFGTDDQKRDHQARVISGEELWCQLFSEPAAGSDVASLRTTAVRDGDEWIVSGQKVWTTRAHEADHGLILTRTDSSVPKHEGLSMFIIDMHASGVEVRPLRMMTGKARFNEVFLSDVRVPASALVGGLGDGWRVATAMLMYERVAVQSGATVGGAHARADVLVAEARRRGVGADPVIRQALVDVYIRETLASIGSERARALAAAGREPGPGGSVGKLASALVAARFRDVSLMVRGAGAMAWDNGDGAVWAERALDTFGLGIGGGTNEIQRNILGERVLGLPKEPAVDRGVPFRELPA